MINMIQVTEKQKGMIKNGYVDLNRNIEKFLYLKSKNYDFKNIDLKDITRVSKNGNFAIYQYNGVYFEVSIYTSGCYMSFDNIMGNWFSVDSSKNHMFKGFSSPKLAIKNYIINLIKYI